MKAFIFWTGIYEILAGLVMFFPGLLDSLAISRPSQMVWTEMLGFLTVFYGVVLLICSARLSARASIVYWIGLLRLILFVHLGWYGFVENQGTMLGVMGVVELLIGGVYLIGLPGAVGASHRQLLRDSL